MILATNTIVARTEAEAEDQNIIEDVLTKTVCTSFFGESLRSE